MDSNSVDSMMRSGFGRLLEIIITGDSKEETKSINRIKSDYQKNFEEKGWELIKNIEAGNNKLIDFTKSREKFRLLRKYCERFYPEKRIRLARAHDTYDGKKIDSRKKIVAFYARDRE